MNADKDGLWYWDVVRVFLFCGKTLRLGEAIVRRGRPGHTSKTRRTYRRGCPAANSLSRIFVRIGYRLNGLPYTIPDSMPGSLDCAAGDCNPLLFRRHHLHEAVTPQAVN